MFCFWKNSFLIVLWFTNRDYGNLHFIYGLCSWNAHISRLRYPERSDSSRNVFARILLKLAYFGVQYRRGQDIQDVEVEKFVLYRVYQDPACRLTANSIEAEGLDVLQIENYHPSHFTLFQALEASDPQRRWNLVIGFYKEILRNITSSEN